jgi:hypothetical protein
MLPGMRTLDDALAQLRRTAAHVPSALRRQLVSAGADAVPALVALVEDRDAWQDDAPGEGWPPIHAVELLGEIGDPRALAALLAALPDTGDLDVLRDKVWLALPKFGPAALEPLLAAHDETEDDRDRADLAATLAQLGVRDDRVLPRLFAAFERHPDWMAPAFADYGDPAVLPHLQRELDARELDAANPVRNMGVYELADAIERLGGELTAEQLAKVAEARGVGLGQRRALERATQGERSSPVQRRARPGRNEACWCGSGKKYKRCHLDADERSELEREAVEADHPPVKLSAALLAVAGPLLDEAEDDEALQRTAIETATLAWNLAVTESFGEPGALARALAKIPPSAERDELEEQLVLLMERKNALFPADDRTVEDATLSGGPDGPSLMVKFSGGR